MAFQKGYSGNPSGRPSGSQNRSTAALRDALALLVDGNVSKMEEWLDRIAADDPKSAFQCMLSVLEFHLPKRSRISWIEESDANSRDENAKSDTMKFLADVLEKVKRQGYEI